MLTGDVPNRYEQAFESWLVDNKVRYTQVDQHKRTAFNRSNIKSFDFLLYPGDAKIIIAEVKGRKFHGTSLAKLTGIQCWVTLDDIEGLTNWQKILGKGYTAVFIFAYKFVGIDVDTDGRQVYEFDNNRYIFFAVALDDYCSGLRLRSPKWRTVTLPADKFRKLAVPAETLLVKI